MAALTAPFKSCVVRGCWPRTIVLILSQQFSLGEKSGE